MRSFAKLSLATLLILLPLNAVAESKGSIGSDISNMEGMRPEWFTCTTSEDCGEASAWCGSALTATNIKFRQEVQNVFCAKHDGCASMNCPAPPPYVAPVCVDQRCIIPNPK